jgi:hypothetical protein
MARRRERAYFFGGDDGIAGGVVCGAADGRGACGPEGFKVCGRGAGLGSFGMADSVRRGTARKFPTTHARWCQRGANGIGLRGTYQSRVF